MLYDPVSYTHLDVYKRQTTDRVVGEVMGPNQGRTKTITRVRATYILDTKEVGHIHEITILIILIM